MKDIERRLEKIEDAVQAGEEPVILWIIHRIFPDDGSVDDSAAIKEGEELGLTEPLKVGDNIRRVVLNSQMRGWILQNWNRLIPEAQGLAIKLATEEEQGQFLRALQEAGIGLPE